MSINIAIGLLQFFQLLNGLKLQYVPGRESESLLFRAACCGLWGVEKNSLRPRPKRSELPTGIYSLPSSGSLRFGLASQAARKKNCRARAEVFCFYGEARICRGLAWHAWLGLATLVLRVGSLGAGSVGFEGQNQFSQLCSSIFRHRVSSCCSISLFMYFNSNFSTGGTAHGSLESICLDPGVGQKRQAH